MKLLLTGALLLLALPIVLDAQPATRAKAKPKAAPRRTALPKVGLLKPADFAKFKDAARGQVLVINFWATWCGPCVAEFPEFVMLDKKYRAKGVKFVGISADEIADLKTKVVPFIKEQKPEFEMVIQDTDDIQQMMDAVIKDWTGALPVTVIFDKQGKLAYQRLGIIDREVLVAEIEKVLQ